MMVSCSMISRVVLYLLGFVLVQSASSESYVSRALPPRTGAPQPVGTLSVRSTEDPEDVTCSPSGTRGVPPVTCSQGLTCVLFDFGFPAVDRPSSGTCQKLTAPVPKCSVTLCASAGATGVCTVSEATATCSAWATRRDSSTDTPNCNLPCPRDCPNNAISSNGRRFCNACVLRVASCEADFSFSGPISPEEACSGTISPFLAPFCCEELGVGCLSRGDACSTTGSLLPPVPCEKGLECVVTDFGFPAVDLPTTGVCVPQRDFEKCTVKRCCRYGPKSICRVDGTDATCNAWASRTDGGSRPDCSFSCPQKCVPWEERPQRPIGRRFCNFCYLCRQSCKNNFK